MTYAILICGIKRAIAKFKHSNSLEIFKKLECFVFYRENDDKES